MFAIEIATTWLAALIVAAVFLTFLVIKGIDRLRLRDAEVEAREIVARAEREGASIRKEAELEMKEMALKLKGDAERELTSARQEIHERERKLDKRQDLLDQTAEQHRKQEKMVEVTQRKLAERIEDNERLRHELDNLIDLERQTLHKVSSLTREEATQQLMDRLDRELQHESGNRILLFEKDLAKKCESKAREVLLTTIQRYASSHTAETTTSTVDIPNDEMKGRIIGREGRNIRAFEKATGVDVIIDDTPGVVIVTGFDPVRREVARLSLEKLIADGRIHPSRIEELVAETGREIEALVRRYGE
jgi:ribonuclease Y